MTFERRTGRVMVIAVAGLFTLPAAAQTWPDRSVRIIVPFAPGGGVDTVARVVANRLTAQMDKPFVVENRPGAGGTIGAELAAKASPDGYTLLTSAFEMSINPSVRSKLNYDVFKDFVYISQLASANYILACHPTVPVKTVKDLIALAKARPGQLNYGSSGVGGGNHLTLELFSAMAGIRWVHVPYKGSALAITAVISGEIDCTIGSTNAVLPQVLAGRARALGVTGTTRVEQLPDLPTISESAIPGYVVTGWYGFYAPAGTPPDVIRRLYAETKRALESSEAKEQLRMLGNEPVGSSPQEFLAFARAEADKWAKLVKDIGLKKIN